MAARELVYLLVLLLVVVTITAAFILKVARDARHLRQASQRLDEENRLRLDYLEGQIDYDTLTAGLERLATLRRTQHHTKEDV